MKTTTIGKTPIFLFNFFIRKLLYNLFKLYNFNI